VKISRTWLRAIPTLANLSSPHYPLWARTDSGLNVGENRERNQRSENAPSRNRRQWHSPVGIRHPAVSAGPSRAKKGSRQRQGADWIRYAGVPRQKRPVSASEHIRARAADSEKLSAARRSVSISLASGPPNGVGTGRLVKIAAILGVPVAALLEGADGSDPTRSLLSLMADRRSFRLVDAFAAITDRTARLSIVNLVEKIAAAVAQPQRRRR
jgi:hypothetical protein